MPFMTRVAVYQNREFPRYRAGYAKQAYGTVWENDMVVQVKGTGNTTLRFTRLAFAANKNIADMQRGLEPALKRLRFKRVEYATFERGQYSFFGLTTTADGDVGVWIAG